MVLIGAVIVVVGVAVAGSWYLLHMTPAQTPTISNQPTNTPVTSASTDRQLPDGAKVESNGTIVRPDGISVKPDGTVIGADGKVIYSPAAATPKPPAKVCVDNILCIKGTHWSSSDCKCVKN